MNPEYAAVGRDMFLKWLENEHKATINTIQLCRFIFSCSSVAGIDIRDQRLGWVTQ